MSVKEGFVDIYLFHRDLSYERMTFPKFIIRHPGNFGVGGGLVISFLPFVSTLC